MDSSSSNTINNGSQKYKIFVKTVSNKVIPMLCTPNTSIISLKMAIQQQEKIPINSQRLIADAKILDDKLFLRDYPTVLKENGVIFCLLNLPDTQKVQQQQQVIQSTQSAQPKPQNLNEKPILSIQTQQASSQEKKPAIPVQQAQKSPIKKTEAEPEKQKETKPSEEKDDDMDGNDEDNENSNDGSENNGSHNKKNEQDHDHSNSKKKKRGKYSKRACIPCKKAHSACDSGRPCKRCLTLGIGHLCQDAERKKPKKRTIEEPNRQTYSSLTDFLPLLQKLPNNGADGTEQDASKSVEKQVKLENPQMNLNSNMMNADNMFNVSNPFGTEFNSNPFESTDQMDEDSNFSMKDADFENGFGNFFEEEQNAPHHSLFEDDNNMNIDEDMNDMNGNLNFDNSPFGFGNFGNSPFGDSSSSSVSTSIPDANSDIMQKIFVTYIQQAAELEQVKNLLSRIQNVQNLGQQNQFIQQM